MVALLSDGIGANTGDILATCEPLLTNGVDVFYVKTGGNDALDGLSRENAFATLGAAHAAAAMNDIIVLCEGFTQTLTAGLSFGVGNITIVGEGSTAGVPSCTLAFNAAGPASMLTFTGFGARLRNIRFTGHQQTNAAAFIHFQSVHGIVRDCRFECSRYDTTHFRAAPVAGPDQPYQYFENCTWVSTGTSTSARPGRGLSAITGGMMVWLRGCVFDGGTYNFGTAACDLDVGPATRVWGEELSLLRGADMLLDGAICAGYVNVTTATGGGKVVWS